MLFVSRQKQTGKGIDQSIPDQRFFFCYGDYSLYDTIARVVVSDTLIDASLIAAYFPIIYSQHSTATLM